MLDFMAYWGGVVAFASVVWQLLVLIGRGADR